MSAGLWSERWRQLGLHVLGIIVSISGLLVVAPLLPAIITHFEITPSDAGIALSLMWGANALGQYPGGRYADGLSADIVILASQGLLLLGFIILALPTSFLGFIGGLILIGAGYGLFEPAGIVMLYDYFDEQRGRAFGIRDSAVNLGSVLAAGLAIVVLHTFSWQIAFIPLVIVLFGVTLCTASMVNVRDSLSLISLNPQSVITRLGRSKQMYAILLVMSASMFIWQGGASFLPTYLQVQKSFTSRDASLAYAGLFITGIIATPIAGAITERHDTTRTAIGATMSSIAGLSLIIVSGSSLWFSIGLIFYAIGVTAIWPIMYINITDRLAPDRIGSDLGALRTIYFAVGSLGPAFVGLVATRFDYTVAFASLLACFIFALVPLAWLDTH